MPHPQVVLGIPLVPSQPNLDFWLRLCNVRGLPEAEALLRSFPSSEGQDRAAHKQAVRQWNADFISKVRAAPAGAPCECAVACNSCQRF